MQFKKSFLTPTVIGLIAIVSGGWLLQQGQGDGNVYQKMRMFRDVVRTISDRYVEPLDPSELYDMAIEGLLQQLEDPHSTLLRPEDYSELRLQTTGNYGGLGIRIGAKDDWVTVVQTLPNTPAERAGLRPGDRIIQVEGESARGWTEEDAVKVLRGPKGAPVEIKVMRVGVPEPIPFRIVRDEIHVEYSTGFMYDDGIGYVQLRQFSDRSADDIRRLIGSLREQGMKALILDLRGNPGGLLEEGVAVSDLFLDRRSAVVETRSRLADQNEIYYASRDPVDADLPLIVLVDNFSASASEIVSGALQDHDRALVLGQPTFGKGLVQTLYQLPEGNYLKLTTAKWYTPSGRSIQRDRRSGSMAAAHGEGVGLDGEPVTSARDTSREVFYTDGGRKVFGGGGITPDLIVTPDTLTTVEQQFRQVLGDQISAYSDVIFRYAVEYSNDRPDLTPDFEVTTAMLDRVYERLQRAEVDVPRELYDGSERLIARELAVQIATVAFADEEAATRRRLVLDRQVELAAELLREGPSQRELFTLASARRDADDRTLREQ